MLFKESLQSSSTGQRHQLRAQALEISSVLVLLLKVQNLGANYSCSVAHCGRSLSFSRVLNGCRIAMTTKL